MEDPVFPRGRNDSRDTESAMWRIVQKAAQRAGLELPVSLTLAAAHAPDALDRAAAIHLVGTSYPRTRQHYKDYGP